MLPLFALAVATAALASASLPPPASASVPGDSSRPGRSAAPTAGPAPIQPRGEPVPRASPTPRFTALVLRNEGIALDDLPAALALRIPDLPILRESPSDGAFVFVAVRSDPATPVRHQIGVITSDGAAYYREVDTGADPPARVLASVLANLLVSIAEGSVQPDRTDVAIPPPDAELATPPAEPTPQPDPPPPQPTPPPAAKPVPKASPPQPRWEYGLNLAAALDLALGPPRHASTLAAAGGSLGLDLRHRRGLLLGLDLRTLGRRAGDHGVVRLRVAALAGYALRRGRFELPIALGLAIEPWWLDAGLSVRPLYGAFLRTTPGLYLAHQRGPLRALRIGPRLELGGSFIVDDGPHVAGISQQTDTGKLALFRLGGLELSLGLELTLWFARPRTDAPRTTRAPAEPLASRVRER